MIIFKDKQILDLTYIPDDHLLLYREKEREKIKIVIDSIHTSPSHLVCYGFSGTGKTMLVKYMMRKYSFQRFNEKLVYLNASDTPTELQAVSALMRDIGVPVRGKIMSNYYEALKKSVNDFNFHILVVIDELDKLLFKSGDNFIYNLLETGKISVLMITNNVMCFDRIEDRVKSRLGGMPKLLFEPYDANHLREILNKRAGVAMNSVNMEKAVIPKISAIAAQEHGDARRAISLLRSCGEIAEQRKSLVLESYIEEATDMTESNEVGEIVNSLPIQAQAVLTAICDAVENNGKMEANQSEVYDKYTIIAKNLSVKVLTDRRISDYIWEMEGSGLIITRIGARGRHVREKKIKLGVPARILLPIIKHVWKDSE